MSSLPVSPVETKLRELAAQRILVLDGAMGTMIQALHLDEAGFRGARFDAWNRELRGNNDLLNLTRPLAIHDLHLTYLRAGVDIIATNTFSSTSIAQGDYGTESLAYELNLKGARLARAAADIAEADDARPRFVAGAIGPTNRTASISPDVANPGFRAITFDQLRAAYAEQVRGLLDGGADILLVETIFDTLNAKAALYAISDICEQRGARVPVMISGTITDRSGRLLSGQTPTAFWHSVAHAQPFSIGFNCALGARELRAHIAEMAQVADTLVCAYPNAGLPNAFGRYDESAPMMGAQIEEFATAGLVNIVGGCCGSTPEHIRAIVRAVAGKAPRPIPQIAPRLRLSGFEPFTLTPEIPFVNIGERTNVTGSARFRKLIKAGDFAGALAVARDQVENGAQIIDVNMDEGLLDSEAAMVTFLNLLVAEPDIARVPVMVDSSKFSVMEAGLKCLQGKAVVNSISPQGRRGGVHSPGPHRAPLRRRRRGDGVRREGPGRHARAQDRDRAPRLRHPDAASRVSASGHHFRSQHLRHRHRDRRAQQLRPRLHRGDALDPGEFAGRACVRRGVEPLVCVSRQRTGSRSHALGIPVPRHRRGHGSRHRQCRPDRGLRRSRSGAAHGLRGRRSQPQAGRG